MMNTRKTKRADLERSRTTFFLIGMAITLGLMWAAFEHKSYDFTNHQGVKADASELIETFDIPITPPPQEKPKPKIKVPVLEIIDNSKKEALDIDIPDMMDIPDEIMEPEVWEDPIETYAEEPPVNMYDIQNYPEFPGGEAALMEYLASNISYPEQAVQLGLQGTVYVGFIIEKDGSISNVKVLRGFDKDCSAESENVVKEMPKWSPGEQFGKKVRVNYILPVSFTLK